MQIVFTKAAAGESIATIHRNDGVRQEPFPWTDQQVDAAVELLQGLAASWQETGRLDFRWPDRLINPVPVRGRV